MKKTLLVIVLAMLCGTMQAAIFQNTFTTNQNTMGTGALISQSNNLLGVNNTDTNTFLRSGGTGTAPYFSVIPGSSASSPVNNFYATNIFATNVTVVNLLTVSNISVTNITVQNNLTVSNLYTVNGNHSFIIVTNALKMPFTTLTMSGSNVSAMDFNAASMWKVTATNDMFIGAPSNLPGTNLNQTAQLFILQDGTGGRIVTFTNSAWLISGSGASTNATPTIQTNAGSQTIVTFSTSPFSATKVYGVVTPFAP